MKQEELIEIEKKAKLEVEKVHHKNRMREIREEEQSKIKIENLKHEHSM